MIDRTQGAALTEESAVDPCSKQEEVETTSPRQKKHREEMGFDNAHSPSLAGPIREADNIAS